MGQQTDNKDCEQRIFCLNQCPRPKPNTLLRETYNNCRGYCDVCVSDEHNGRCGGYYPIIIHKFHVNPKENPEDK